jgi:site-specific DNA-methyltransferase (adenine-specific)
MKELLNKIHHADCLEFMKQLPDKCIDLVLTDPPYGINISFWDKEIPTKELFSEIFRISKNQIIFGGNYFNLPHSQGWICWDKTFAFNQPLNIGEFELAWTNLPIKHKFYRYTYCGNISGYKNNCRVDYNATARIHPTQKPFELFKIILSDFAKQREIILDCFSGSGTTALACHDLNLDFICIEKDEGYHKASVERLEKHKQQLRLL